MSLPELTRIRAALAAWKAAPTLEASFDAEDEYSDATDQEAMDAVLAHIDQQQAEIDRLKRGEFICQKCSLRKDSENPATHTF